MTIKRVWEWYNQGLINKDELRRFLAEIMKPKYRSKIVKAL